MNDCTFFLFVTLFSKTLSTKNVFVLIKVKQRLL